MVDRDLNGTEPRPDTTISDPHPVGDAPRGLCHEDR